MNWPFNSPIATNGLTGNAETSHRCHHHVRADAAASRDSIAQEQRLGEVPGCGSESERIGTISDHAIFDHLQWKGGRYQIQSCREGMAVEKMKDVWGVGLLRFVYSWCLDKTSIIEKESRLISSYSSSNDVISSYWILSLQLFISPCPSPNLRPPLKDDSYSKKHGFISSKYNDI